MPDTTLLLLTLTAASVGFIHTVTGPDHFLPFIAMAKAGNWSFRKTMWVTSLCGVVHVLGSVLLGLAGLALGAAVAGLESIEEFRGNIAGWLLLAFGLAYTVWGVRQAYLNRPHTHPHYHADGTQHSHEHTHHGEHAHLHPAAPGKSVVTPWLLFLIFVFGPCEPLIPLLMYPAAQSSLLGATLVAGVFGIVTLVTMLTLVTLGYFGLAPIARGLLDRYAHAACGVAITACGLAVCLGL